MKHVSMLQQAWPVHFLRSTDEWGDGCYFVLRTPQQRFAQLMRERKTGAVDIADYGEILLSGYGDYPSEAARTELEQRYGVVLPEKL